MLVAGWATTTIVDTLAAQTGLGSAFMGATLLALTTSLPELSTTIAAARHDRYPVAISNVFGRSGTVLRHAGPTLVFVAAIASAMTCVFLWGAHGAPQPNRRRRRP